MSSDAVAPTEEDMGIAKLIAELCETLRVDFKLNAIMWKAAGEPQFRIPSDQVDFVDKGGMSGRVVLPLSLRGKLELADWKPLLASSLFIQRRPEMRRIWTNLPRLLKASVYTAVLAVPFLLIRFLSVEFKLMLAIQVFTISFFLLSVTLLILGRFTFRFYDTHVVRGLRLRADWQSSRLIGREQFILTLKKVEALRIEDLEEKKREKRSIWRGPVSSWPTIIERLENLQENVSPGTPTRQPLKSASQLRTRGRSSSWL